MTILEFIERFVASDEEWREYLSLSEIKDPGIFGVVGLGLSRSNSPDLFRRYDLEASFNDKTCGQLLMGDWKLEGRWHSSMRFQEIDPELLRKLNLKPLANRAENVAGYFGELRIIRVRRVSLLEQAIRQIETFCAENSPDDTAKEDVFNHVRQFHPLSQQQLEAAWKAAVKADAWTRSGRRNAKARRAAE
jgi:hypothetical protein